MNSFRTSRLAHYFLRIAALEDRVQYYAKNSKVPEETINLLAALDPTEGKYLGWLISNSNEILPFMKDEGSRKVIREALSVYDKAKKSPALLDRMGLSPDINKVNFGDLYLMWAKYKKVDLTSEREKIEKAKKVATKVIYNKGGYKIIKIEGDSEYAPLAACIYAKGTKWCTSKEETAAGYLMKGPLYILFKDGQKIMQTDLKEWKDITDKEIDIMNNDEISRVFVDAGLLNNPETILWHIKHKYVAGAPRWPAVEPIMAKRSEYAYEYAMKTGEPFKLGEPAIARNAQRAFMYAVMVLNNRFPEGEETIMASPEWRGAYNIYLQNLKQKEEQEQRVPANRILRLAHRLLRIAGLKERIQYYVKNQGMLEENLQRLAKGDPTDGKYLGWLIHNIVDPFDFSDQWYENIKKALTFYQEAKSKKLLDHLGLPGDISKISLDQLWDSWTRHRDEDLKSRAQQTKKAKSKAKVLYSKGPYKILQIGGEGSNLEEATEAACSYSQGTAWCTRTNMTAKGYLEQGPLFIAFKGKERLFLANYRGSEIHDVHNEPIKPDNEMLFLMLESGLLNFWADKAYEYNEQKEDRLFNYLMYHLDIYPYKHPELLQYIMDHRLVSPERMARYLETAVGKRLPNVEAYIASDPRAALVYSKYTLSKPWPEGEPAIRSVPAYWHDYQKYFEKELAHV